MLPNLSNLSLSSECVPCGVRLDEPDYSKIGMVDPEAPENQGRQVENPCPICDEPLDGPARANPDLPDALAIELVSASQRQYHRYCLADWVCSGKYTDPLTRIRISDEEIASLRAYKCQREKRKRTTLIDAVKAGDVEAVQDLILEGADVNATYERGDTALLLAVGNRYFNPDVVQELLRGGADVNARHYDDENHIGNGGNTVFITAALSWNATPELLNMLLVAGADINGRNDNGNTALMEAAMWTVPLMILDTLISAGADLEAINNNGATALHTAMTFFPEPTKVKALIAAGANLNAKNIMGDTPLQDAIWSQRNWLWSLEAVKALIKAGANVNTRNDGGYTPLSDAVTRQGGSLEIINTLIKAGAKVDDTDNMGNTPLMHAAREGNLEAVKALIAVGADVKSRNNDGKTALNITENEEVRESLIAAGATVPSP